MQDDKAKEKQIINFETLKIVQLKIQYVLINQMLGNHQCSTNLQKHLGQIS